MTDKEFKKTGRILKEAYKELEADALYRGVDIFGDEFKRMRDTLRGKILGKLGFNLNEYRAAKELVSPASKVSVDEQIREQEDRIGKLDIPTVENITAIAEDVAKRYIVEPVVTNQIVKETVVREPTVVKETVIKENHTTERVEYDDRYIMGELGSIQDRIDSLKNADPLDVVKLKEEIKNDFELFFEHNINILDMPDFRKLAMGLQGQIDDLFREKVPYTGATGNVDLGSNTLSVAKVSAHEVIGDLTFVGAGVGLPYGHIYNNGTIAVTITDETPVEIGDTFITGVMNICTFGSAHYIVATKAGTYKIDWTMSIAQNSPSAQIQCEQGIMIGGTASVIGRAHRTIANSNDIGASAGTAILTLTANQQVSLYVTNLTNTTNIDVEHANLNITMIGG